MIFNGNNLVDKFVKTNETLLGKYKEIGDIAVNEQFNYQTVILTDDLRKYQYIVITYLTSSAYPDDAPTIQTEIFYNPIYGSTSTSNVSVTYDFGGTIASAFGNTRGYYPSRTGRYTASNNSVLWENNTLGDDIKNGNNIPLKIVGINLK